VSYVVVVVRGRLLTIGRDLEEAAQDLGATPLQSLRTVVLPLLWPAIFGSQMIVFATSIDDFVISAFLSADASTETVPIKIYSNVRGSPTPALNALATAMLVGTAVALVLAGRRAQVVPPRPAGIRRRGLRPAGHLKSRRHAPPAHLGAQSLTGAFGRGRSPDPPRLSAPRSRLTPVCEGFQVSAFSIRAAVLSDRNALYEICRLTGDAGEDASAQYEDPDLLGAVWVGSYLALEPDLAFVGVDPDGVVGYVLGAADTVAFEAACAQRWWPDLRQRYPEPPASGDLTPDEELHKWIHHPPPTPADVLAEYPAHLHIDLLPRAQGRGLGRRLLDTLLDALRRRGVGGVHLGVDAANSRAIGFYEHLGFVRLASDGDLYGLRL
jgi:ribosomal protein S18 acetylase RimI-like enzyme